MRAICVISVLLVFLGVSFAPCVLAEDKTEIEEQPWKRFAVHLGANLYLNNSEVRLGPKGVGVAVDTEELLGLESNTTSFRLDGYWRFKPQRQHRLDFSWFSIRCSGDNTVGIQNPIEIKDIVIEPNAQVQSNFNIDVYQVGCSYSFFKDKRLDLAVGGGLYVMPVEFDLTVKNPASAAIAQTSESITASLPTFNLRSDVAITPRWFLRSRAQLFYLEISNFSGGISDFSVGVEYLPFRNVGFGLQARSFTAAVEAEGEEDVPGVDFLGRFEYDFLGAMLYLKFFFGK